MVSRSCDNGNTSARFSSSPNLQNLIHIALHLAHLQSVKIDVHSTTCHDFWNSKLRDQILQRIGSVMLLKNHTARLFVRERALLFLSSDLHHTRHEHLPLAWLHLNTSRARDTPPRAYTAANADSADTPRPCAAARWSSLCPLHIK